MNLRFVVRSLASSSLKKFYINPCRTLSSNRKKNMANNLIWVDCEMTGLDVNKDRLLEIAAIITDEKLNERATFGPVCIFQTKDVLDNMNDWCKKTFAVNGLTEKCSQATHSVEEVDQMLENFLVENGIKKEGILAGNSIGTDRVFLDRYCSKFTSRLHYRMVDVSSIKVLVKMWYQDVSHYNKATDHRALGDIQASIAELKYYRDNFMKQPDPTAEVIKSDV